MKGFPTKRRIVFVVLGVFALMAGVAPVAFWPGEREPEYQGKKLSQLGDEVYGFNGRLEFEEAVIATGEKGIPFFIKWIREAQRSRKQYALVYKMPGFAGSSWVKGKWKGMLDNRRKRESLAETGFYVLGVKGVSGIPELKTLAQSDRRGTPSTVTKCLSYLGPDGLNALLDLLRNTHDQDMQLRIIYTIADMPWSGDNVAPSVPFLIELANGTNAYVSGKAMDVLENFGRDHSRDRSGASVPFLIEPGYVSRKAMDVLEDFRRDHSQKRYGTSLRLVVVQSLEGLNFFQSDRALVVAANAREDSNENARRAATNSFMRIFERRNETIKRASAGSLRDPSLAVRRSATNALRELAPEMLTNGAAQF